MVRFLRRGGSVHRGSCVVRTRLMHRMATVKKRFVVVLRRANGRLVKMSRPMSRYAAKLFAQRWDDKYDHTYRIDIEGCDG